MDECSGCRDAEEQRMSRDGRMQRLQGCAGAIEGNAELKMQNAELRRTEKNNS
jgi:hypothetical protein